MSSGIYEIVNTVNGHRYVGSAVNIDNRWAVHKYGLRNNKSHSRYLQHAWNKYGEDSFEFRILEHCFFFMLIPREQYYMDMLEPEYNILSNAGNNLGLKHTEETRAKMSEAKKKHQVTEETRAKISKANKGRVFTPEWKANMSESRKGNKNNLGNILTQETKDKISNFHKRLWTEERKAEHSKTLKNYWARRRQEEL